MNINPYKINMNPYKIVEDQRKYMESYGILWDPLESAEKYVT